MNRLQGITPPTQSGHGHSHGGGSAGGNNGAGYGTNYSRLGTNTTHGANGVGSGHVFFSQGR